MTEVVHEGILDYNLKSFDLAALFATCLCMTHA